MVRLALDVWRDGQPAPVGRLDALEDGNLRFSYTEEALASGRFSAHQSFAYQER